MHLLVCHKMGHLVWSVILSLLPISSSNILKYLSVVPPHQESRRADRQVCGWFQGSGSPQAQRGWRRRRPAQLRRPLCVLQEVHGAVLPAQHRRAHDRPHHHLPEVPSGIRLENSLWKPAQVSFPSQTVSTVWRDIPGRSGCFVKMINKYILVDTRVSLSNQHNCIYFTISSKVQIVALRNRERPNRQSQYCFSFNGPWQIASYLALISSQICSFLRLLLKRQPKSLQRGLAFRIALTLPLGQQSRAVLTQHYRYHNLQSGWFICVMLKCLLVTPSAL